MIKAENLFFRYEDEQDSEKYALKNINMHIKEGEFVVIIGHNGSGKSTLTKKTRSSRGNFEKIFD